MGVVAGRGRLCPVCLKPAKDGACGEHGPWQPHQLATTDDRRAAARRSWQGFEPLLHACPRCLGEVAEARNGFECVDHAGHHPHGPFEVDELLAKRRPRPARPALHLPNPARLWRLVTAATVLAATVAFLSR